AAAAVSGKVISLVLAEVGLHEALMIAEDGPHLAGPGVLYRQDALSLHLLLQLAFGREDDRLHAEEWLGRRSGLGGNGAGKRADHVAAGFRLPPRVDDLAALLADMLVIPEPGLGVDRLADRPEQAQRGHVVLVDEIRAGAHQRADRRRRGVEDADLVLLDDLPEAAGIG